MEGEGVLYGRDYSQYHGEFRAGKKNGKGDWTTRRNQTSRQFWKDDVLIEDNPVSKKEKEDNKKFYADEVTLKR